MAQSLFDLCVSTSGTRSVSRSVISFVTASLLQLGVGTILILASLLGSPSLPQPQLQREAFVLQVTPPAAPPARAVPAVRRRYERSPSREIYRSMLVASDTIPGDIPDPFGLEPSETGGIDGGAPWSPPTVGSPAPQVTEPEPIRAGGGISPPKKVKHVDPLYPDMAKAARIRGIVILEAVIDAQGRVRNVHVLRSVPLLDDAAVAAVQRWEYEPTLLNGLPVPVIVTVTVRFEMY